MSISFYTQNVQGLRTKYNEFSLNICNINSDFICLTETWLHGDFFSSEYLFQNFKSHRRDRNYNSTKTTKGGGCWIIHKPNINSIRRYDFECNIDFIEDIWIQVKLSNNAYLYICTVYITPMNSNNHLYVKFVDQVKDNMSKIDSTDRILLIGDFNVPKIEWSMSSTGSLAPSLLSRCNNSLEILDLISFGNLTQYNSIKNHHNKILDLVLSTDPNRSISVNAANDYLVAIDQYHPPLEIVLLTQVDYLPEFKNRKYNFRKANFSLIRHELENINWNFIETIPLDQSVKHFYDILNEIIHNHTPLNNKNYKFPFWYDRSLKNLISKKERARSKWKRSKNINDYFTFSKLRSESKKHIKLCYESYLNNVQANIKTNIKQFWAYAKSMKKSNSYPSQFRSGNKLISDPKEICDHFAEFFESTFTNRSTNRSHNISQTVNPPTVNPHYITLSDIVTAIKTLDSNKNGGPDCIPNLFLKETLFQISIPLQLIFNKSLNQAIFPLEFKTATITPIFKKGDETIISNYRPICISNAFAIIFEKIVHMKIVHSIENQLSPKQHGFTKSKSTDTNLLEYVTFISNALEEGSEVHSIYTDFSKAFDSVNHTILLNKLRAFNLHINMIKWFQSYLTDRIVYVTLNGFNSYTFSPSSVVPQGSVLGPLLFNVFINDLSASLQSNFLLFADDLKIFNKVNSRKDMELIQSDIASLHQWCNLNEINLNIEKCNSIVFSNKHVPTTASYYIGNHLLNEVASIRDLGIIFDKKLKFDEHIDTMVSKAYKMLGFIMRITTKFKDIPCIMLLYNSLVRSRLEYNTSIWNPKYDKYKLKLENVQRKFTRLLFYKMQYQQKTPNERLKILKLKDLETRREFYDTCMLHKVISNINAVSESRPRFGNYGYATRIQNTFYPPSFTTDYGIHKNPSNRAQILFNKKFNEIDIMNLPINIFKAKVKESLDWNQRN